MSLSRVTKKLVPQLQDIDAAIIMVNASDPQLATVGLFLAAVEDLTHFIVLNKCDLVSRSTVGELKSKLKGEVITASLSDERGLQEISYRLNQWRPDSRVLIGGVFNSGKTSLINALTGKNEPVDDIPGTTLELTEHYYNDMVLIDSTGQIIDISLPLMFSVDLTGCETIEDKLTRVMHADSSAIDESLKTGLDGMSEAVSLLIERVEAGNKVIICGAGASGLVAKEMAGQGQETDVPVLVFTNDFAFMQPISFAKGSGENEEALAEYIALASNLGDVIIGISASGGTGFVFRALELARSKGAHTIAITENRDTPLGKAADIIIKSEAKPEGPSSSRIQAAHLAIGHAL